MKFKRAGTAFLAIRPTALLSHFVATVLSMAILLHGEANGQSTHNICGIGVVVAPDAPPGTPTLEAIVADHINVTRVYPDSPGKLGGLLKGDDIVAVNGASIVGMKFYDVVTKLIRGDEGTSVSIIVKRKGSAIPLSLTIVRRPVRVEP